MTAHLLRGADHMNRGITVLVRTVHAFVARAHQLEDIGKRNPLPFLGLNAVEGGDSSAFADLLDHRAVERRRVSGPSDQHRAVGRHLLACVHASACIRRDRAKRDARSSANRLH